MNEGIFSEIVQILIIKSKGKKKKSKTDGLTGMVGVVTIFQINVTTGISFVSDEDSNMAGSGSVMDKVERISNNFDYKTGPISPNPILCGMK